MAAEAVLARATAAPAGTWEARAAIDAALTSVIDAAPELAFRLAEVAARQSLDPKDHERAVAIAEPLLERGLAARCELAQHVALLVGETRGKDALVGRLRDLERDAELARAADCQRTTEALLASLGAKGKTLGVAGAAPRIESLTPFFSADSARVVIALEADADASALSAIRVRDDRLSDGTVTSMHLPGILADGIAKESPGEGLVTRIVTTAAPDGTDVRFELAAPGQKRVHFLLEPPRIVIDLAPAQKVTAAGRKVHRIFLDPGHGGFDPGATGPSGVREKDVALDVALRAARALRTAGFDVQLSRDADHFVAIERRSAMANAADADLFVSVHCNASESPQGHGIETYVLDDTRGGNDSENRVAARENGGSQSGVLALSALLAQTRVREHSERSRSFAEKLQRDAVAAVRPHYPEAKDGGVHPAAFSVLVGARMPAVLFETSYVSSPRESAWLAAPEYRQRLADALVRAIGEFAK